MIQLNINQNSYQAIIIKHENDLTVCEEHSHNFFGIGIHCKRQSYTHP